MVGREPAGAQTGGAPDPSAYGLDLDVIRSDFAFYHDRFGVRLDR